MRTTNRAVPALTDAVSRHADAMRARAEVVSGALRGPAFLERLLSVPLLERDTWTDELLGLEPLPADAPELPRGAVPYLPCGVDEVLALVRDVAMSSEDEFVDLGSGLGRVAMLVHLLTGVRAHGIEIQEHLVASARTVSTALGLSDVSFVHSDAAEMAFDGSVFFLYAPFNGPMLAAVLRRIEEVARRRSIIVGTVGLELRGLAWLRPRASSLVSLCLYESRRAP